MQNGARQRNRALGEAALGVLVKQFGNRFDFIRELVQNSLDSGTAQVEVWTAYQPLSSGGVCEIHVDDDGIGMNETIIDEKLTQLFSSSKEDDLTNIGKFGIGFVSVFALNPDGVLVRTAQGGEQWEVFFQKDRSFEKTALTDPVEGTKITVYKKMSRRQYKETVVNVKKMLTYWCKHAEKKILFFDSSAAENAQPAAVEGRRRSRRGHTNRQIINQSLVVDGEFPTTVTHGETTISIGFKKTPFFGFYNHGLTLKETDSYDILGWAAPFFKNVVFKVKSPYLEHTLTRDTILLDDNFEKALLLLVDAAREDLIENLLQQLERLASTPPLKGDLLEEYRNGLYWLYTLQRELDPSFDTLTRIKDRVATSAEYFRRAVAAVFDHKNRLGVTQKSVDAAERPIFRQAFGPACAMKNLKTLIKKSDNRLILSPNENVMAKELAEYGKPSIISPSSETAKQFFLAHIPRLAQEIQSEAPFSEIPTVFGITDGVWIVTHLDMKQRTDAEKALFETLKILATSIGRSLKAVNFLGDSPERYLLGGILINPQLATIFCVGPQDGCFDTAIDINGKLFQKLAALYAAADTRALAIQLAAQQLCGSMQVDAEKRAILMEAAEELLGHLLKNR